MTASQTITKPSSGSAIVKGDSVIHSIGIAGLKVVTAPDAVRTVLGSCIGIALFDRVAKVGGLGHVILPDSGEGTGDPKKFADTAIDILIEELVVAGALRQRIVAKIAGGAAMFGDEHTESLGSRNADAVRAKLTECAIRLAAQAVGGSKGRKMCLFPATGVVVVERIGEAKEEI